MSLSTIAKKALKAKAHHLDPVIMVGQKGITPNLIQETEIALEHHELIKVKIQQGSQEVCDDFATQIAHATKAEFIAKIGRVLVFYRKKKELNS
ncbi:MAG: ribosome assembly RNA-binding protein YhbY [Pseudomonadota bacterium]